MDILILYTTKFLLQRSYPIQVAQSESRATYPLRDALSEIGRSSPVSSYVLSAEFLGKSDEKPFGPTDVAEPIDVFTVDDFAY